MATAAVQHSPATGPGTFVEPRAADIKPPKHDVATIMNYYKDPGDGSLPPPSYAG
jgi:hypothetical protein